MAKEVEEEIKGLISQHSRDSKIPIIYEIVKKRYCFEYDVDNRNEEIDVLKLSYSF